jgi:Rod binding domain-containing protein
MPLPVAQPSGILPRAPGPAELANPAQARAWKTAQDFEAMVLGQFVTPMLATVDSSKGPFGGGAAESTWRPMLAQELGRHIAKGGGLGLAVPVYHQMLHAQELADRQAAEKRAATTQETP